MTSITLIVKNLTPLNKSVTSVTVAAILAVSPLIRLKKLYMGIFFFCSECIPSIEKLKQEDTEPPAKKQTDDTPTSATQEHGEPEQLEEDVKKPSVDTGVPKLKSDTNSKVEDICPLLLKGTCPHGLTGANCTNGRHPVRCWKYSKYGTTSAGAAQERQSVGLITQSCVETPS